MAEISEQVTMAVMAVRLSKDQLRTVCIKEGSPLMLAYNDNNDNNWTVIDNFLDKYDYILNQNCLLGINDGRLLFLATVKGLFIVV